MLRKGGFKFLGRTRLVGDVSVKRRLLQEEGALAVLFCDDWHFCGAIPLNEPRLEKHEHRVMVLAGFAVR